VVFAIAQDRRGRMWFGTAGGAAVFTPDPGAFSLGSTDPSRWRTFTPGATPLPGPQVHALAEDRDGRIYLGTEHGLAILDERSAVPTWQVITASPTAGASHPDARPPYLPHPWVQALAVVPDGRVWIGTKDGLAAYTPAQPSQELPVYRPNPVRRWTGWFWPPHAAADPLDATITALAWQPAR
jgi:ligand-binding sensor domain-containing protein